MCQLQCDVPSVVAPRSKDLGMTHVYIAVVEVTGEDMIQSAENMRGI